jgi:peptidoglycan-associated lipoprotein
MIGRYSTVAALGAGLLLIGGCSMIHGPKAARFTPCSDVDVAIYFQTGSSAINPDARAVLKGAADKASGCRVDSAEVMGLTDAVGDPEANMRLSEQRAAAVTKTLRELGLTGVSVTAGGESGAITDDGERTPLRRRTDVKLRLSPNS